MKRTKKCLPVLSPLVLSGVVVLLAGCATGQPPGAVSDSGLSTGNADLSVKMASSIFLQPVSPSEKLVLVEGHNTSSAQNLNFSSAVDQGLKAKGYQLTQDPGKAEYMLMYNVRYVGKETKSNAMAGALAGGYGGALIGAVHSYRAFGNPYGGGMAGSLIGAGVGALAGHYLSDKTYMMVVDIQLQQRDANATTSTQSNITQGLATTTRTSGATMHGWMTYRDRIVAQAKGMRLSFDYAKPALVKEVSNELAGIF